MAGAVVYPLTSNGMRRWRCLERRGGGLGAWVLEITQVSHVGGAKTEGLYGVQTERERVKVFL